VEKAADKKILVRRREYKAKGGVIRATTQRGGKRTGGPNRLHNMRSGLGKNEGTASSLARLCFESGGVAGGEPWSDGITNDFLAGRK